MKLLVLEASKMKKLENFIKQTVMKFHTGEIQPNQCDLFTGKEGLYIKVKNPKIHEEQIVIDIVKDSPYRYSASVRISDMRARFEHVLV